MQTAALLLLASALLWVRAPGRRAAARHHAIALAAATGCVLLARSLWPDREERSTWQYAAVISLGWPHLAGAFAYGWPRLLRAARAEDGARRTLLGVFLAGLCGLALCLYLAHPAWLVPAFLLVAFYHTAENALLVAHSYADGLAARRIPRTPGYQARALGLSALLFAAALLPTASGHGDALLGTFFAPALALADRLPAPLRGDPGYSLGDVFCVSTLYHLVSWLVMVSDRLRARPDRRRAARLVAGQVLGAGLCLGLLLALPRDHALAFWAFHPAPYLFFSGCHAVQTAITREIQGGGA